MGFQLGDDVSPVFIVEFDVREMGRQHWCLTIILFFEGLKIGKNELTSDDLEVTHRIDRIVHVDDVTVFEQSVNVGDR